jgi:hypothetical protein
MGQGGGMAGSEPHQRQHGGMQHAGSMHSGMQHSGSMNEPNQNMHRGTAESHGPAGHEATGASGHQARHVQLSSQQRTRFVETIRNEHVTVINHVNFAVNVGVAVPATYHYYPLPPEIVSFVPEYSGYYFLLADGNIIIIDPATREIVDVIPEA